MSRDVIDHLAEIPAGSRLDEIRRARPDAREHAQQSFLALLEPAEPGALALEDRYAVAAYVALLHDAEAAEAADADDTRSRSSSFYLELLADAAEPAILDAVRDAAVAGRASGPYGDYREPQLRAEAVAGPVATIERGVLGERLAAALEHAHLLVLHPRDARPESLRALTAAGWGADAIVSLSQLIAFLAFQLRLVHGLRVLAATPAPATPAPAAPATATPASATPASATELEEARA
ncbi:CMD domain protein [Agrococcus sp. ARC_14]|uniref:CMD domain protein n=1 Tax=Agrococcus sp. ARC_14 TaxID=2919927 RepID=UPI001F0644FD|nr:CMD domain protein [Agrococcus sp. ARC_14]MCH1883341.1 CMD domain protein [Agrococcus sp. ARC_14]